MTTWLPILLFSSFFFYSALACPAPCPLPLARCQARDEEVADLKAKTELLDVTCEEKITEEKEKIVTILEAGFIERQKVALQQLEARLQEQHRSECRLKLWGLAH